MKVLPQMKAFFLPCFIVVLICFQQACSRQPESVNARKQIDKTAPNGNGDSHSEETALALNQTKPSGNGTADHGDEKNPDHEAILKKAQKFMEEYNNKNAKAIAALFAEDANILERDGTVISGRDTIEAAFAEIFANNPAAQISLGVDSLALITPDVALERGKTVYFPDGETATLESEYNVVHVKKNGEWIMSKARTINHRVLSPYAHLRELEWMIGKWVDEGEDSIVETVCEWSENKSFLLRKFTVQMEGYPVIRGTQRIGWDPIAKQIKSWVFDTEGGHATGDWNHVNDTWVAKVKGYTKEGVATSSTNQFSKVSEDRMHWMSVHRLAGDEHLPDLEVVIVRQPPEPKQ